MLKFGRLVDLEKLETVSVNRTAEELKERLRGAEATSATEIDAWDVSRKIFRTMLAFRCDQNGRYDIIMDDFKLCHA